MNILKRCYDFAANFYGNSNVSFRFNWLRKSIAHTIRLSNINVYPNCTILDLGCGTGIASEEFLKIYPDIREIVGVDISSKMGKKARENLGAKFVFYQGDYTEESFWQKFTQKFQGILAFYTLHWISLPKFNKVIQYCHNLLNEDGWVLGIIIGPGELGGIFNDLIPEILQIYLPSEKTSSIMNLWSPKDVSVTEEIFNKNGFYHTKITSIRYLIELQNYNDLISIILYQYNFWVANLSPSLVPAVREKLVKFIKDDVRFRIQNGIIIVPHHLIILEAHKKWKLDSGH